MDLYEPSSLQTNTSVENARLTWLRFSHLQIKSTTRARDTPNMRQEQCSDLKPDTLCYVRSMATIQEAVQNAMTFARATLGPGRTQDLQLEEVESGTGTGSELMLDARAPREA